MPTFTKEQQEAIDKEGMNILVSAGAGSGKTAVLTERVLRKVKEGIPINHLLILTFTNKAALEMKERIRKKLQKENLQDALGLLDSSYITTFDAFSLATVKKYADKLHLDKEMTIVDETILQIAKQEQLELIMDTYYQQPTPAFEKLITSFCLKEDESLKKMLLSLHEKLDLLIDREAFLDNYVATYYQEQLMDHFVEQYLSLIEEKRKDLGEEVEAFLSLLEEDYYQKVEKALAPLFEATSYEAFVSLSLTLPRLPNGTEEEVKAQKEIVKKKIEGFQALFTYETEADMKKALYESRDYCEVVISILQDLDKRLIAYKQAHHFYNFMDIEKLAITLVRDHEDVREEMKNSFQEILIDEYQDTNDIQETFIHYIAKNNVYMVGDVKQSIYRFRNANPMIFKEKYDAYKQNNGGYVIDLAKNFRSRREVLDDINDLFSKIMDDEVGGASYNEGHAMIFGNQTYEDKAAVSTDHHLSLLQYNNEDKEYKEVEKEAFIIAQDIKQKIAQGLKVYDKDQDLVRPIAYGDIAILLDRSTDFITYKQIFAYVGLPLTLWQDEKASSSVDLALLKNLFVLGEKIYQQSFDTKFAFCYASIARSFLYQLKEEEIYQAITTKKYQDTPIYQDFLEINKGYEMLTPSLYLLRLLEQISYEEKLYHYGSIHQMSARMEYFYSLLSNLEASGYSLPEVTSYLEKITEGTVELKIAGNKKDGNSVKIMTIHTSKGLEYPLCYFAGYAKKFNEQDFKQPLLFDKTYGFIFPDFKNQQDMITKTLLLHDLRQEDISEKIRLFYVALTRAREKMIVVLPQKGEILGNKEMVSKAKRLNYHSFLDMLQSIDGVFLDKIKVIPAIEGLSKDYLLVKKEATTKKPVTALKSYLPSRYQHGLIEKETFATPSDQFPKKEAQKRMQEGIKFHTLLERTDLKRNIIPAGADPMIKRKVEAFLESAFMKQYRHYKLYQEYEFISKQGSKKQHGKIDLLLVGDEEAIIVDYKLKNVSGKAYEKQLKGYQEALTRKLGKKVRCYLYSILEEMFTPLDL